MQEIRWFAHLFVITCCVSPLVACEPQEQWPSDLRAATLDVSTSTARSETIVLAVPLDHRDLRSWSRPRSTDNLPPRLVEVETTLRILQILKGPPLPAEIRFRFYDGRDYPLIIGPPKGPSGPVGSPAIFFLLAETEGVFRSSVDLFRPDLPVPWLTSQVKFEPCASPSECIIDVLLNYHQSDDWEVFKDALLENTIVSERLIFLTTLQHLTDLATSEIHPEPIRNEACSVLRASFVLELPPVCYNQGGASEDNAKLSRRSAALRGRLREGRVSWVREHIHSDDASAAKRYLQLLAKSPDSETRWVALDVLSDLRD